MKAQLSGKGKQKESKSFISLREDATRLARSVMFLLCSIVEWSVLMPTFQVRNTRTKIILGEVVVDDLTQVLPALADVAGCTIDDVAASLGSTLDEAKAALDIVEVAQLPITAKITRVSMRPLKRKSLFV